MREIQTCPSTISTTTIDQTTDLRGWLTQQAAMLAQASADKRCWLLGHCDDGVIWGELRDDRLHLSCEAFPVQRGLSLRWITLQQARLFGESGELLLWRGPQGWQATLRRDDQGESIEYIDEEHLLWGNVSHNSNDGFMQIVEGQQGIMHAPPLATAPSEATQKQARARLKVRHYLGEDDTGVVRIVGSRLIALLKPGANA